VALANWGVGRVKPGRTWNEVILATWEGSDAPAIVTEDRVWNGTELLAWAGGAAKWLDDLGFAPGAIVPAVIDESPSAIALAVGAALSGRALAPLSTKMPVGDLVGVLERLGSIAVIAEPKTLALVTEAADKVAISAHCTADMPDSGPIPRVEVTPDTVCAVIHTSGTTGNPKPVLVTQGRILPRVQYYHDVVPMDPGDRWYTASPFSHTAGCGLDLCVLAMGAAIIPQDWFTVESWSRAGALGLTTALLVATMIDMLLTQGKLTDAHPKQIVYGAMPIHPDTLAAAIAALPNTRFVNVFGQTEVSPISAMTHEDHLKAVNGRPELLLSVGRAQPGIELRLENPDKDGIGEIAIKAPHAFVKDDDGWRRTGDLGVIDDEGYVFLRGRMNDRIIRGGENIFPTEIENLIIKHPKVKEVAVVGQPDRKWGEVVKAVIVAEDPSDPPDTAEITEMCREHLLRFKVPTVYEFIDELPRNPAGKVLRRKLI